MSNLHWRRWKNTSRARPLAIVACLAWLASTPALAGLGTAIEFYNASINHYFITAYPEEAAALDAGTNVKGWKRTGGQFSVFTDAADGLAAVCRFFGTPGKGPNSHFYTADPAECAKVKTLPAWTYEGIAFYIPLPTGGQCGGNWPVYRSYYADEISDANHRFTVDLTAHVRMKTRRGDALEGIVMCAPVSDEEREADIVRLLEQATLGPTEALVAEVKAKGIGKWLDEQLALNVTRYTQLPWTARVADPALCGDDPTPPVTPEKYCNFNTQLSQPVAMEFFRQSRTASDQLRLRMAHNWHEIFFAKDSPTYGVAVFQQRLRDDVFKSFETLLTSYTLSPLLGHFQNWLGNVPEHDGIKPNENYARELLQLMTIGTVELNEDGTLKLDAKGLPIATYGQGDVETLARVLTGYGFASLPPSITTSQFYENYLADMVPVEGTQWHDRGAKVALGGRLNLPAGGDASGEVHALLRVLVNHPNTPPFIVKQLIQKTVTSSPTPGYVQRMVEVFKDNGHGVRGDLAAVTKAILLDPEARGARKIDREYGRLREPALFWTHMIRALDIATDGMMPYSFVVDSGQRLFEAPTVFSYYPADYTLAGGGIPAPEYGLYGSSEFVNRANMITGLLYHDLNPESVKYWGPQPYLRDALGTPSPKFTAWLADAADPEALVARVDRLLTHGALAPDARKTIVNAVAKVPSDQAFARVALTFNLILVSIDYQVQR